MGAALNYAREKAPPDVRDLLDWLAAAGFTLVSEEGGPAESTANVLLIYERSPLRMRITRDRGQWLLEIAVGDEGFILLHVLLTAREAGTPVLPPNDLHSPLPEVLPDGVNWRTAVPDIVAWLESGQRAQEIGASRAAWRQAMASYLKPGARRP